MSDELYCKVSRRMWSDESFGRLSGPQPNAKSLWQYLLTGPHYKRVPGLFILAIETMAADHNWPIAATREVFQEILDEGMARYDTKTKLLWLPAALHHNKPTSVHVIAGWTKDWKQLPECHLLREATAAFRTFMGGISQAYFDAFARAVPADRPSVKAAIAPPSPRVTDNSSPAWISEVIGDGSRKSSADQEKEKEKEQERDLVCEVDPVPDTKRARDVQAHTPVVDVDSDPAAAVTVEHIQALVKRYPILSQLWPEHLEHIRFVCFDRKLRFGQAREAFADWFAKCAHDAPHAPAPALLKSIASYLTNAQNKRGGRLDSGVPDAAAISVHQAFDALWCKRMGVAARAHDEGDDRSAAHVARATKAHAEAIGASDWVALLNAAVKAYLGLNDPWLADKGYPLSLFARNKLGDLLKDVQVRQQKPAEREPEYHVDPVANRAAARESKATVMARLDAAAAAAKAEGARRPTRRFTEPENTTPPVSATSLPPETARHLGQEDSDGLDQRQAHETGRIDRREAEGPGLPEDRRPPAEDCGAHLPRGVDVRAGPSAPGVRPQGDELERDPGAVPEVQTIAVMGATVDAELAAICPKAVGQALGRRKLRAPMPGIVSPAATGPPGCHPLAVDLHRFRGGARDR